MGSKQNWSAYGEQIKNELTNALQTGDFSNLNELVTWTVAGALNEANMHFSQSVQSDEGGQTADFMWQQSSQSGSGQREAQQQREQSQREQQQREQSWREQQQSEQSWREQQQREQQREQQRVHQLREQSRREQQQREQQLRERQQREERQREQQRRRQEWQSQQQQKAQQKEMQRTGQQQVIRQQPQSAVQKKLYDVGSVSGVLYQVFGGIGLGISGLVAFIRLFISFAGFTSVAGWVVNILFIVVFFGILQHGTGISRRLKRAKRYIQLCGAGMYGQIANLARDTGKSERYVIKDIQKMLSIGMFPEGHLDEQKTCLMLDDGVYRQYLEAEKSRRIREQEEAQSAKQKKTLSGQPAESAGGADSASASARSAQEAELNTMIEEGTECIRRLRDLNDMIPGEVISAKLYRLENLLKEIFGGVREHPGQMHRMHKLMDYYLPTTIKLVEAYEEFDRVSTPGEEIIKAKGEIEKTLDTINKAFTELLNNLFQDTVFDVTTDAQVLQTMLAREGLTKEMEFVDR